MLAQGIVSWTQPEGYECPNEYDLHADDFTKAGQHSSLIEVVTEAASHIFSSTANAKTGDDLSTTPDESSFLQSGGEGGGEHETAAFGILLWRAWHRASIISDHLIFLALLPPSLMEDALSIKRYALKNVEEKFKN